MLLDLELGKHRLEILRRGIGVAEDRQAQQLADHRRHGEGKRELRRAQQPAVEAQQPPTHVIFCVDNSGSMRKADAKSEDGSEISRAAAVTHCCLQLVEQQQMQLAARQPLYSLILFDDEAEVPSSWA